MGPVKKTREEIRCAIETSGPTPSIYHPAWAMYFGHVKRPFRGRWCGDRMQNGAAPIQNAKALCCLPQVEWWQFGLHLCAAASYKYYLNGNSSLTSSLNSPKCGTNAVYCLDSIDNRVLQQWLICPHNYYCNLLHGFSWES